MGPGMQLVSSTQCMIGYKYHVTSVLHVGNCTSLIKFLFKRNLLIDAFN